MIVTCIPGVFSSTRRGKEQFLFSKNCGYVFRSVWQWPSGSVQEVHCLALLGTFRGLEQLPRQLCQKHLKGYTNHSHPGQVMRNGKQVARKKSLRSKRLGKVIECEGNNQLQKPPFAMDNRVPQQIQSWNLIKLYEWTLWSLGPA